MNLFYPECFWIEKEMNLWMGHIIQGHFFEGLKRRAWKRGMETRMTDAGVFFFFVKRMYVCLVGTVLCPPSDRRRWRAGSLLHQVLCQGHFFAWNALTQRIVITVSSLRINWYAVSACFWNMVLITNSMLIMISLPAGRFEASRGEVCLGLALISMLGPCEASRPGKYRPIYSIIFLCCFEFFLFLLLLFMPAPHWHYLSE